MTLSPVLATLCLEDFALDSLHAPPALDSRKKCFHPPTIRLSVHIHQATQGATLFLLKSVRHSLNQGNHRFMFLLRPHPALPPDISTPSRTTKDGWLNENKITISRDRRTDRRSLSSNFPQTHPQRSAHHSSFSHAFPGSSDMIQPPTFHASYARPNEIQHSISSWESWDMHHDPNFSVGHIRRFDEKASSWAEPVAPQIPSMVPQQFNNLIVPSESTPSPSLYSQSEHSIPLDGFNFPHRLSPLPSPAPSPVQEDVKPNIASLPSNSATKSSKTE
jgi:hypothetical protein